MPVLPLSLCVTCASALLLTSVCSQDDLGNALRQRIQGALDRARPALLSHLRAASDPSTRPGVLALLVLAGAHDGLTDAEPVFAKAVKRLAKANPDETYDLALRLMVCEALPWFPDRLELARADLNDLLQHRSDDGAFGYGGTPSAWDLSNTQYGALGLRAARALGLTIDRTVWSKLAATVEEQQSGAGGFNYGRGDSGFGASASMTAAGISVLAICAQELGERDAALTASLQRGIESGWRWFRDNKETIGSTKERNCHYFHYGLERAAILTDVTQVGGVDWYAAGAGMFMGAQLRGGGWHSTTDGFPGGHLPEGRGDAVATSFAVLFLRRKFQKTVVTGPTTPMTLTGVGPRAEQAAIDACAADLVRRGKPALPDVFNALRSDVEPRRRAAANALQGIAGDSFGYDPALELAMNLPAVHRAELWYLKNR